MDYTDKCLAMDVYNNWEMCKELQNAQNNSLLLYDNIGKLCLKLPNGTHRHLNQLEIDVLMFIQNKSIDTNTMSIEEFDNKFILDI